MFNERCCVGSGLVFVRDYINFAQGSVRADVGGGFDRARLRHVVVVLGAAFRLADFVQGEVVGAVLSAERLRGEVDAWVDVLVRRAVLTVRARQILE